MSEIESLKRQLTELEMKRQTYAIQSKTKEYKDVQSQITTLKKRLHEIINKRGRG